MRCVSVGECVWVCVDVMRVSGLRCVCVWEGRERGRRKGREREEEREKAVGKEREGAGEERGMGRKGRAARGPQRQVLMSVTNT